MEKKVKKNGEVKKSGGKRKDSGRSLRYNEKTKTVAFRVPTKNSEELKSLIKERLNKYSEEANPLNFSTVINIKKKYKYTKAKKERVLREVKKVGKTTVISYRVPKSKVEELKAEVKNKLNDISFKAKLDLLGSNSEPIINPES